MPKKQYQKKNLAMFWYRKKLQTDNVYTRFTSCLQSVNICKHLKIKQIRKTMESMETLTKEKRKKLKVKRTLKQFQSVESLTYKEIKNKVGDAWALIANPEYSEKNGKLIRGILVFFDTDKKKVHEQSLNCEYKHITVRYFGEIDTNQIFVL